MLRICNNFNGLVRCQRYTYNKKSKNKSLLNKVTLFKKIKYKIIFHIFLTVLGIRSFVIRSFTPITPVAPVALVALFVKSDRSDLHFMKEWFALFKSDFKFVLFNMLFPFVCPKKRANRSSSFFSLYLKNDIPSHPSFKKEQFTLWKKRIALLLFCSQKQAIHTKNLVMNDDIDVEFWICHVNPKVWTFIDKFRKLCPILQ